MFIRDRRTYDAEGVGGGAGGGTTGGTDPNAGGGSGGGQTPAAWHAGVDAETLGHWQTKGWDLSSPLKVATEATKAYKEAERYVGAPPSEIIRMPKAGDEAGAKAMWQRLGAPPDAAGYDFSTVKKADGSALDAAFDTHLRGEFSRLNVPKDTAAAIAQSVVKFQEQTSSAAQQEVLAKQQAQQQELAKNWGANMEANRFVAKQAALALKVTAEDLDAMEARLGGPRVMELFRQIGERIGEGKFVSNMAPGGSGVMTREQAVAKRADLMKDSGWVKRYTDGGTAENRELQGLLTMIHGDDTASSRGM